MDTAIDIKNRNAEISRHLAALSEFFDSVHILATFVDNKDHTYSFSEGFGNWYARISLAKEFSDELSSEGTYDPDEEEFDY